MFFGVKGSDVIQNANNWVFDVQYDVSLFSYWYWVIQLGDVI